MAFAGPKRVLVAALAFIIVVSLCAIVAIWRMREDAIADSLRETDNIATIMAEQVGHTTRAIEIVLDEMLADVRPASSENDVDFQHRMHGFETFNLLKYKMSKLPQVDLVAVTDRNGRLLSGTRGWPATAVDVSDRDFFRHLSSSRDSRLYVSEPFIGQVSGLWTIFFAKRIERPNGSFAGTIYIGVRPDYIVRTLDVIASIPHRTLMLLRRDGSVLLRYPEVVNHTRFKIPLDSPWYRYADQGGHYRSESLFEDQTRLIAVRPVPDYPLVVDVGISEEQVLSSWMVRSLTLGSGTIVVVALFVFLMSSLYRQFVRLKESQQELTLRTRDIERVNQRLDAALSNTTHGIAMFDDSGNLLIKNSKYERILGFYTIEFQFLADGLVEAAKNGEAGSASERCDLVITALARDRQSDVFDLDDGRCIRVSTEAMPQGGWVTTLEDITESQRANESIVRMAHYDGLTRIANRTRFMIELDRALSGDHGQTCGVMLLDLDRFKEVNDTYGHSAGDELLQAVAQRLVATVETVDFVARLGGDEFAILCALPATYTRDLDELANRLLACIGAPFSIQHTDIVVGLSIGIAVGYARGAAVEDVMRHADLALYQAKADGRNRHRFYEPAMEERYHQRKALTIELEQAIKRDELAVWYQPIVSARSQDIVSMEALVRWKHPRRGMISPADFIPLAEECGLIYALGEWVLRRACFDAAAWPDHIRIAVNVSTLQLSKPSFEQMVGSILTETGLAANRLKLEMTETMLLSETTVGIANLNALRTMGIAIILDDFGTGYSSLSYLKRFHFDEIKIDKSFVDDVGNHRGSTAIIAATITLARELDIVTTAEGVETDHQRILLQAAGVEQMQGYLFGKPAPADAWSPVFDERRHA